jgi:uncharacterized protein YbgA (DUF1722 family)/uncharacterized protein YbbK (DUF523 family)
MLVMEEKIRLGISACLLGEQVRYDGGHKLDPFLADTLGRYVDWVPVCPEVEYGLPVPREPMRLVGSPDSPRLVTIKTGIDHTGGMTRWAGEKMQELSGLDLCGFVFKSKSPSSGMTGVKVYSESGIPVRRGRGIFAALFIDTFPLLPVEDEGRLHDPALRENFIERIFVFHRWQDLMGKGSSLHNLMEFHTRHKLLIMSHSARHYRELGRLVAEAKGRKPTDLRRQYIRTIMEGLRLIATPKKQTNVLQHIMGYFKKQLSSEEKQELISIIEEYHRGILPLIVPLTLLRHYVRKYDEPYLKTQYYLNPHPAELMLRNHV